MSFLPYSAPNSASWFGALGLSTVAHGSLASVLLFSSAVSFLPEPQNNDLRTPEFEVSLEILDLETLDAEPIEDRIPEDAETLAPEDLGAEDPDVIEAGLVPEEDDVLVPEDSVEAVPEEEVEVVEEEPLVEEPPVDEVEVVEAEPEPVIEAEPEPEVATEPEVIAEPIIEAEPEIIAEPVLPEPEPEPEVLAELAPTPEPEPEVFVAEPVIDDGLAIDDLNPIEDEIANPLAEEGGALIVPEAPTEEDVLALVLPQDDAGLVFEAEPEAPAPVIVAEPEIIEPVIEAEPEIEAPVIEAEPEPVLPEETALEEVVIEADPEPETPVEEEVIAALPEEEAGVTADGAEVTEDAGAPQSGRPAVENPTVQDVAIGALIRQIRATPDQQCTLALPRRGAGDAAILTLIGADDAALASLGDTISAPLDVAPARSQEVVDSRQCATLDALRQTGSYPASRIGLSVTSTALQSGDVLQGRVLGAAGLFLTLLVIDDNGVVQDLAPFTALDGNIPVFEAPVARSGPSRATRQLILALGSPAAPIDLSATIGRTAQEVFTSIPPETLETLVFGIASFDVR